ncbi:alpha-glucosidase/alpha-galactosidase [Phycicoccus sp. HDW14]|uniref:alpha-glucosidase/alpha-galactosidase n=1 Tax=Phycicoccus sp. HDW14 TaxID=2714941 RepID=UPI0014098924|nr:alpha-glucosidase/alpha-galactosidase [Phycicoccus sp. HDW14]QIM22235.1 alpha-glucosidase/alpha-galactosidase [Phycicoccus sp. HDW14]
MTRIAFVGAGSVVFTRQLLHDLLRVPELAEVEVSLHDVDDQRLETARRTAEHLASRTGTAPTVTASTDRAAALDGADFVVNMVQVGGIGATRTDFEVPARFGVRQTIGDTLGVGGVFRALRTFPVLSVIAEDMTRVCPDAHLLNYTNPMAMNMWWLSETAPQVRSVGLCHSVYWTVHDLCELLGVPVEEVDYRAAGVNHQAWLLEWSHRGADLYPRLRERVAADPELRRRVRVDMFRRLGWYPTETSEHSSEYVPWYLHDDAEVERLRIPVGDYLGISEDNVREYDHTREVLDAGGDLDLPEEVAEYAPQVIRAMTLGDEVTIHGNVPNRGLVDNLPEGACVEVPCTVDASGIHPQPMGALPPQCAALNHAFLDVAGLTVRAALDEDPLMIRRAVMVDPNTSATLAVDDVFAMCDALVEAHGDLLPEWARARVTV